MSPGKWKHLEMTNYKEKKHILRVLLLNRITGRSNTFLYSNATSIFLQHEYLASHGRINSYEKWNKNNNFFTMWQLF